MSFGPAISTIWDSGTWCFINNDKKEILAIVWDYVSQFLLALNLLQIVKILLLNGSVH